MNGFAPNQACGIACVGGASSFCEEETPLTWQVSGVVVRKE
jgi:hypothetical protein